MRKEKKCSFMVKRSKLMSPWIVIDVRGCRASMLSISSWRFFSKSVLVFCVGRRYMLMIVCMGSVLCFVLWICKMMVFMFGNYRSSMKVMCNVVFCIDCNVFLMVLCVVVNRVAVWVEGIFF